MHQTVYEVEANWKLFFHNYSECYHCPNVHPHLNKLTPYRNTENDLDEGPVLGGPMWMSNPEGSMTMHGGRCARAVRRASRRRARPGLLLHALPRRLPVVPSRLRAGAPRPAAGHRPHAHPLRLVLPPRRDRRARLRPAAGDRLLGPHQPPGLGALRRRLQGRQLAAPGSPAPTPSSKASSPPSTASTCARWVSRRRRRGGGRRGWSELAADRSSRCARRAARPAGRRCASPGSGSRVLSQARRVP